ncbi:hypothetical protein ACH4TS_19850 [Streptomyces albidoflavus]
MDFSPLLLLGRALRAAHLGTTDMRGFRTPDIVARLDRTVLAEHVQAPVETRPEELLELLGVEAAAVVALMAWDRDGRPWLTCTLRSDAARDLAHHVLDALTDEQAAALHLNDALDALAPVGDLDQAPITAAASGPGVVTLDVPPQSLSFYPFIVAATKPDSFRAAPHPQGMYVELTVRQADRLTETLLSAAAPSGGAA